MGPAEAGRITVTVVCSPAAGQVEVVTVSLPAQSTAGQAIEASGLPIDEVSTPSGRPLRIGIWGKPCAASDVLRDRDRVEVYRPLLIDPKDARRARQRQQGKSG